MTILDLTDRHPSTQQIMKFFAYDHLKSEQQRISKPLGQLAALMLENLDDSPELTAGLRKLLEAKDCFVRASLGME